MRFLVFVIVILAFTQLGFGFRVRSANKQPSTSTITFDPNDPSTQAAISSLMSSMSGGDSQAQLMAAMGDFNEYLADSGVSQEDIQAGYDCVGEFECDADDVDCLEIAFEACFYDYIDEDEVAELEAQLEGYVASMQ